MLKLPIQSVIDFIDTLKFENTNYYLEYKDSMLIGSSNRKINNNFFSVILFTKTDKRYYPYLEEVMTQSFFLIDMYSLSLIAEYSCIGYYDYIQSFVDGEVILDVFDDDNRSTFHVLLSDKDGAMCTQYEGYTPYIQLLCGKLSLLNQLNDITDNHGVTGSLIHEYYGLEISALNGIKELQVKVINEIKTLNNNYTLKH
jgi:hypothetical protein